MYGDNAIGESTSRKWFYRFKEDRFDISDIPCSRKTFEVWRRSFLNTLIHNDPRQCTWELANVMNCDHSTIVQHLHSMGKVKNLVLVIDWLVNNIDHSYLVSLLVTKNSVFLPIIQGKERNGWAQTKEYVGNVSISQVDTPLSSVHCSTQNL